MTREIRITKRGDIDLDENLDLRSPLPKLEVFRSDGTDFDVDDMPSPIAANLDNDDNIIYDEDGIQSSIYMITEMDRYSISSTTSAISSFSPNTSFSGNLSSTDGALESTSISVSTSSLTSTDITIHGFSINIDYQL